MACDERIDSLLLDYHLGQLSEPEAEEVRRALDDSAECRERLDEVSRLMDLLPLATSPIAPPVGLKERVLAQANASSTREAERPRAIVSPPVPRAAPGSRLPRVLALSAAAVLLVFLAFLTVAYLDLRQDNSRLEAEVQRLEAQVEDGGQSDEQLLVAAVEGVDVASDARGTVVVEPSSGELAFDAYGLPSAPSGHSYHAWLVGDDGAYDLGEMEPDADGNVRMTGEAPGPATSYETLEVTAEPIGGAPSEKTGPVYLQARL